MPTASVAGRVLEPLVIRPQGLYALTGSIEITRVPRKDYQGWATSGGGFPVIPEALVVRPAGVYSYTGSVTIARVPMMKPAPPIPRPALLFRRDWTRPGAVYRVPLLAPPTPGGAPKPIVSRRDFARGAVLWVGRPMPTINPARVAGGVPPPIVRIGPRSARRGLFVSPSPIPIEPASHLGMLILLRGGPSTSPNIPPPIAREPFYMTDTNQLFVGDGFTRHYIGGDPVAAPAHSTSSGVAGQRAWDGTYAYLCVAANTWIRWQPATTF